MPAELRKETPMAPNIDDVINIRSVAYMLGLELKEHGNTADANCPFCTKNGQADVKHHMNINYTKNVFRCNRCGASGNQLRLYSLYHNIDTKQAYADLVNGESKFSSNAKKIEVKSVSQVVETPLLDQPERSKTYTKFLDMCVLAKDHFEALTSKRGMDEDYIASRGYKTIPSMNLSKYACKLLEDGSYLRGVPGFFRDKSGNWTFVSKKRGILVPYHAFNGEIEGLQLRIDDDKLTENTPKYMWISSYGYPDGTKAKTFVNYSCEYTKDSQGNTIPKVGKAIALTEGGMKGDIFFHLTGHPIIAVPGTKCLTMLREELTKLKSIGVEKVMDCFDMDYLTNEFVKKDIEALKVLVAEMDMTYQRVTWNPKYKGIDDYYLAKKNQ